MSYMQFVTEILSMLYHICWGRVLASNYNLEHNFVLRSKIERSFLALVNSHVGMDACPGEGSTVKCMVKL